MLHSLRWQVKFGKNKMGFRGKFNCILDDLKKDTSEWKSEQKLDFYKFEADKQVTKN